ncbi:ferritin-like domain-containing protein [Deinococcus sonorensis]|uniref:Ferritin-like domain-containing protein n=2 Tax=Deinococcus sonorensis TaxID=309891 RepID=A0AAU7UBF8_9DEIO
MSQNDKSIKQPGRRQFLSTAGLVGAGAVLASCAPVVAQVPPKQNIDVDVLNFALNLEYLEAAFYLAAVGRIGELPGGTAAVGLPSGFDGKTAIKFADPAVAAYANEIAQDELNHVNFLRAALGASAVARPVLDIGPAFAAAANAAAYNAKLITSPTTLTPAFNPYLNDLFFLHGAFIFEDVGVTAYKGAARLITNPDYLEAAAGILAVEAYHAGEIRTLLYGQKDVKTPYGVTVAQLIQAISDLRDAVDGSTDDDQGIVGGTGNPDFVAGGSANIVAADKNSIAYSRTTDQVLNIVYLGGKGKGGFYPNGLNGNIK